MNKWPIIGSYRNTILLEITYPIIYENKKFRLPVNPQKLENTTPGNWNDRDIIGFGEAGFPLWEKSGTFPVESFFPAVYDPTLCAIPESELLDPMTYVGYLNYAVKANRLVHVLITESKINGFYTIRNFKWSLEGGEPGDIYYSLEFKEYRQGSARQFSGSIVPTNPATNPQFPAGFPANKAGVTTVTPNPDEVVSDRPIDPMDLETHITLPCENLWEIATRYPPYDPNLWWILYAVNVDPKRNSVSTLEFLTDEEIKDNCRAKLAQYADTTSPAFRILKPYQRIFFPADLSPWTHLMGKKP